MADIHILDRNGEQARAVFHVAVPVGVNVVGVAWSEALVNARLVTPSVMSSGTGAGQIDTTEVAGLAAGTLLEVVVHVIPDSVGSVGERLAYIRAVYTQATSQALAILQAHLKFWGLTATKS